MQEQHDQPGKDTDRDEVEGSLHPSSVFSRTRERKSQITGRGKRRYWIIAILALAALVLLAWGWRQFSPNKPEGQVLAIVDGEEITATDLEAEARAGGWGLETPAARQTMLNSIIERQLLVNEARKRGMARSPEVQADLRRAEQVLLAKALSEQIDRSVPEAQSLERSAFLEKNRPWLDARERLLLEQVRFAPATALDKKEIARTETLDQAERLLGSKGVPWQRAQTIVDTLNLSPAVAAQLLKVPDGELFYSPQGNFGIFSRIAQRKIDPLPEAEQLKAAGLLMRRQKIEAIYRETQNRLRAAADIKVQKLSSRPAK